MGNGSEVATPDPVQNEWARLSHGGRRGSGFRNRLFKEGQAAARGGLAGWVCGAGGFVGEIVRHPVQRRQRAQGLGDTDPNQIHLTGNGFKRKHVLND